MHLLLVNLYEFGLFLRILLWISVPLIVVALLLTTWLHYRSRRRGVDEIRLSMEGMELSARPEELLAAIQGRRMTAGIDEGMAGVDKGSAGVEGGEGVAGVEGAAGTERSAGVEGHVTTADAADGVPRGLSPAGGEESLSERERNRMYKGILWMKEKYEQYRDLADRRIEQLKDELVRSEQRYQDLLDQRVEGRAPGVPPPPGSVSGEEAAPADAQAGTPLAVEALAPSPVDPISPGLAEELGRQLEEKGRQIAEKDRELQGKDQLLRDKDHRLESQDRQIEELQGQLQTQWQKTDELVTKLQNSSQLLLKISREIDGSLPPANQYQAQPDTPSEVGIQPS